MSLVRNLLWTAGCRDTDILRFAQRFDDVAVWWESLREGHEMADILVTAGLDFDKVVAPVLRAAPDVLRSQLQRVAIFRNPAAAYDICMMFMRVTGVEPYLLAEMYRREFKVEDIQSALRAKFDAAPDGR